MILPPLLLVVKILGFLVGNLLVGIQWILSLFHIEGQVAEEIFLVFENGEQMLKREAVSSGGNASWLVPFTFLSGLGSEEQRKGDIRKWFLFSEEKLKKQWLFLEVKTVFGCGRFAGSTEIT